MTLSDLAISGDCPIHDSKHSQHPNQSMTFPSKEEGMLKLDKYVEVEGFGYGGGVLS